jgi:exopolysaccharide biosynthesis protein
MKFLAKLYANKKMFFVYGALLVAIPIMVGAASYVALLYAKTQVKVLSSDKDHLATAKQSLTETLFSTKKEFEALKNEDQYKINQQLKEDVKHVNDSYKNSITLFEKIQDLKVKKQKIDELELLYAGAVKDLSEFNYASGDAKLADLGGKIKKIDDELAAKAAVAAGVPALPATQSNAAPGSGYSYQSVTSEIGTYAVAIVAADLGSTRVIVDTATDGDCRDNCPVLSLGDYVARNGAFAGINGSYFCPSSYPSCAGKTNSFDTLVMNKNKKYINSDNNVYSTVPVAVFGSGFARFLGASSGWGRDTSVNGVIANQPLLLSGGNIAFGGGSDPKQGSKGARSFVGNKGSTVYIGVVYNATVAEVAYVLKALGLENALNLDSGGSTALWSGGYKVGPGRNIPNAILFVR